MSFKFKMFTLTKIFPQIGWAVPTVCLAYLPRLTTTMNFIHEEHFLRCEWATDIMSSMQCSPFLSAWPTSAPEIAALRSLLPILFCYFTAPAAALQTGGGEEERGAGGSHELTVCWLCFLISSLQLLKARSGTFCENCHYDGHSALTIT